jgi:hypothetical protein
MFDKGDIGERINKVVKQKLLEKHFLSIEILIKLQVKLKKEITLIKDNFSYLGLFERLSQTFIWRVFNSLLFRLFLSFFSLFFPFFLLTYPQDVFLSSNYLN